MKNKKVSTIAIETENQMKFLDISKVSAVDLKEVKKEYVYFDKLEDGTWRIVYTKGTLQEFNKEI